MTGTDRKIETDSGPDAPASRSASPHKDKPRSSAQGAARERDHSELEKSRDVRERDWPALLRHDASYRKSFLDVGEGAYT